MEIRRLNPEQDLSILAGGLLAETGDRLINDAVIEIKKANIDCVLSEVDMATYEPCGRVVDLSGLTVLPGLIDCHVHFALDAVDLYGAIDSWDDMALVKKRVQQYALDFLNNGVLAVRDGSDRANIGLAVMEAVLQGKYPGPNIMATGEAIYKKGQYGSFLGPGINTVADVEREIKKLLHYGISQLKVAQSGLVSFKEYGQVGPVQFDLDELIFIVEMAHSHGLPVMVHASGAEAVDIAVRAGVNSIEHGYFVQTATLELMAEKGTAWVPTLTPLGNLVKSGQVYPGASVDVIRQTHQEQMKKVKEAWDLGVLLGVGTDAGANQVYHGVSYHEELAFYQEAGLKPAEIIKAATANSAQVLGWEKMLGVIGKGKIPFIIAVKGNPLADIKCLSDVQFVLL